MSDCQIPGWGTGPWGTTPWGGQDPSIGGPLPTTAEFDIYCFGPCGPMSGILTHPEVTIVETATQFSIDMTTLDLVAESGGAASTNDGQLYLATTVPSKFTYEFTAFFRSLPANFGSLVTDHIFFGVSDASGPVVGLFFSGVGIAYTGSVHVASGTLSVDGPLQVLPNSAGLIDEGDYFTIRIACDGDSGVVYIYVTRTSELSTVGHQLRFIMPALRASDMAVSPIDQTMISVRGTAAAPSVVSLDNMCLGTGLLIPNIVPSADAGSDQAIQRCSIAQLDGSRSFDPEGAPLTYQWRLIDAPLTSQYFFHGLDGTTRPQMVPTGFTDRFYSAELGTLNGTDPLTSGEVIAIGSSVYIVDTVGTDGFGFYVRIQDFSLPDNLSNVGFKYLRQRGISGPDQEKPTFYPDVAGLYRFELVVFDGGLFSEPSFVVLNVTESPVARGVTPDIGFVWDYLSDFWRLVEDGERIETLWSGVAQVAAAELLTLWQIDYSKSLRDIQRSFQRRWLHYDFLMQESDPEGTTFRTLAGGLLTGSGTAINPRSYKVDVSLDSLGIQEGDYLVLDGVGYRIARVIDDPGDTERFQRLSLLDEVPIPASTSWTIPGQVKSTTLDFNAGLVTVGDHASVEIVETAMGTITTVSVPILGISSVLPGTLAIDPSGLLAYLAAPSSYSVFFKSVLRRKYLPLDPLVLDIPYLQEKIHAKDDTEVLRRNVDYFIESFRGAPCLRFVVGDDPAPDVWQHLEPPARMWAEVTYLDNRPTIEANFGIPAGFTLDDLAALPTHVDYLSSVRGLWYAYFNGPTLFNLKAGTQILLGLPYAEETGTIEEIRTDFSATQGRILVRDAGTRAIVRSYTYPVKLGLETNPDTGQAYKVGDTVAQFAPLVTGVEIHDSVKTPTWFRGYLEQGVFYEIEKFFKFLVRVDSTAFNLAALLFVQTFVRRIKPTYTFPLFVVLEQIGDTEISTSDATVYTGHLLLNDLGVTNGAFGMSTMIDEGHPAGGGWQSQLDTDSDPTTGPPVYPTSQLVLWGSDKNFTSPEDAIVGSCSMVMPHNAPPTFSSPPISSFPFLDGIFRSDLPLYDTSDPLGVLVFEDNHVWGIPAAPTGYTMQPTITAAAAGTYNYCQIDIAGDPGDGTTSYELVLVKNGVDQVAYSFNVGPGGVVTGFGVALTVAIGNTVGVRIRPAVSGVQRPYWHQVTVQLYNATSWALDTAMADGTYGSIRAL